MTIPLLPPKTEPLVDNDKFMTLQWLIFQDELANGDAGTTWTPTFVGLTEVGTATKTGVYYRLSKKLVVYRIVVTPGTNTSATAGTTYCDNFPLVMNAAGPVFSLSDYTATITGSTPSNRRIYTGTWAALTTPITITGIVEAS